MSPFYAVILFRFFCLTFLIRLYMLSFISRFKFAFSLPDFISPFIFHHSILFCDSFSILLFHFTLSFSPFYFAIFFQPSISFRHSFLPFCFVSPFFLPFYFVFLFIFSNANSFPHFYIRSSFKYILAHADEYTTQQHYILLATHEYLKPNNTAYDSRVTTHNDSQRLTTTHGDSRLTTHETWNPTTLHTTHDSQRLTTTHNNSRRLTATHESRGEIWNPITAYFSRLTRTHDVSRVTCFKRMYMIITHL